MNKVLFCIKTVHTIIWAFYVLVIGYIIYAGIIDKIDVYLFTAIGLVLLEGILLLFNRWRCPLTILGDNYSDSHEVGFDIFLPKWLAKHNKFIFSTIFAIGLIITIYRLLT